MNLKTLKGAVDGAIEMAKFAGVDPETVDIHLQIDTDRGDAMWSKEDVELHYDNDANSSGCTITAYYSHNA